MKVYSAQFQGFWTGGCAVVSAPGKKTAIKLLRQKIESLGAKYGGHVVAEMKENAAKLTTKDLIEMDLSTNQAIILDDGDE